MGGVKRHCPVFSSTWNWSKRSRESEGELPLQASSASLLQMTKPRPGTPSRHLLEEAASASKTTSRASSGRAPKAPLIRISSLPLAGTKLPSIPSTAKVPLPCMGTQTWVPVPPPSATSLSRTRRLMAMNFVSREPQSWSIACFTVSEVVSGPGVSSQGSWAVRSGEVMAVPLNGELVVAFVLRISSQGLPYVKSLVSIFYIGFSYEPQPTSSLPCGGQRGQFHQGGWGLACDPTDPLGPGEDSRGNLWRPAVRSPGPARLPHGAGPGTSGLDPPPLQLGGRDRTPAQRRPGPAQGPSSGGRRCPLSRHCRAFRLYPALPGHTDIPHRRKFRRTRPRSAGAQAGRSRTGQCNRRLPFLRQAVAP